MRQTHLDCEQCGLGVGGVAQRLCPRLVENDFQQRLFEYSGDCVRAPAQGCGEHRLSVEQLARHARVLAALTGEQPRCLWYVVGFAADQTGRRAVVGERAQKLDGGVPRVDHQRGAVLQMCPARSRGVGQIGQRRFGVGVEPAAVPVGDLRQSGGGARR